MILYTVCTVPRNSGHSTWLKVKSLLMMHRVVQITSNLSRTCLRQERVSCTVHVFPWPDFQGWLDVLCPFQCYEQGRGHPFNTLIRSTTKSSGGTGELFLCFLVLLLRRVCVILVLKPVPRKSQDVIIILSSLHLGCGHFNPREGPDLDVIHTTGSSRSIHL